MSIELSLQEMVIFIAARMVIELRKVMVENLDRIGIQLYLPLKIGCCHGLIWPNDEKRWVV